MLVQVRLEDLAPLASEFHGSSFKILCIRLHEIDRSQHASMVHSCARNYTIVAVLLLLPSEPFFFWILAFILTLLLTSLQNEWTSWYKCCCWDISRRIFGIEIFPSDVWGWGKYVSYRIQLSIYTIFIMVSSSYILTELEIAQYCFVPRIVTPATLYWSLDAWLQDANRHHHARQHFYITWRTYWPGSSVVDRQRRKTWIWAIYGL